MSPYAAATTSFCVAQQVPQTGNPSFPSILPPFATASLPVTQATGIIFSLALQPIPARLVQRIQLAYCQLIIREALRHGRMVWLDYN